MIRKSSIHGLPRDARSSRTGIGALAVAALLAGCSTSPLSFIADRQVTIKTEMNRFPVNVVAVDGSSQWSRPLAVTAGPHMLVIEAEPVAGFREPLRKTYAIKIEPCSRYYLAADRASRLMQDWTLVVEQIGPVGACDPDKEIQKGLIESGARPALSAAPAGAPAEVTLIPTQTR